MSDEKVCLICGSTRNIQQHHVFGGVGRRKVSDREGCVVWLCAEHHTGKNGVHLNHDVDLWLKRTEQRRWEAERGGGDPRGDFIRIFGKSYL